MSSDGDRRWIVFGQHDPVFAGKEGWLALPLNEFNQHHVHVQGLTGSGKSRFLAALTLSLINAGQSVILLDPNGDLAQLVLSYLVANGAYHDPASPYYDKVLFLDLPKAEQQQRFVPFNVLNQPYAPHVVSRSVVEAMRRTWPDIAEGQAVGLENIILMGALLLIYNQMPLPLLAEVLTNKTLRQRLVQSTSDADVRAFFQRRYDRWGQDQVRNIESPLRRLLLLTFSPVLRYSLSQQENLLDIRALFDQGKSLIVNLALNDKDERKLLGCLLTVYIEQAVLSYAQRDPSKRTPGHVILDEFSDFTATGGEAFKTFLNMARKYGKFLVLANQTHSQIPPELRGALQNCGIDVAFQLGRQDAELAAMTFGSVSPLAIKHHVLDPLQQGKTHPQFYTLAEQWEQWTQVLTSLKRREALVKLNDQIVSKVRTLAVPDPVVDPALLHAVEEHYLSTLFRPQTAIEQDIQRWTGITKSSPYVGMEEDDDILRE